MIEIFFATGSAICLMILYLINRFILKDHDALSYAFIYHIGASLLLLPFFLNHVESYSMYAWGIAVLSGILWSVIAYCWAKCYNYLEVSIVGVVGKATLVFVFLFGILFFSEGFTWTKLIGTVLILIGISLASYNATKLKNVSVVGVGILLFGCFLEGFTFPLDNYALNYFSPWVFAFLTYAIPPIIWAPFLVKKKKEFVSIVKAHPVALVCATVVDATFYVCLLKAFEISDSTTIYPIVQIGSLMAVIAGIIILKEREHVGMKILAAAIAVVGAIVIVS